MLKISINKCDNMIPYYAAVQFGAHMYNIGFKHGIVIGGVAAVAGVITREIIVYKKDDIKQFIHDTKVNIQNKAKKS